MSIYDFTIKKADGTDVPMADYSGKVDVRGETAIPLFRYLADNTKFNGFGKGPMSLMMGGVAKKMDKDYKNNGEIKWNFTKFLIGRDGTIVTRFEPTEDMKTVAHKVKEIL